MAEHILYWEGGGRGYWWNSPPENFEMLKLGNATFSILGNKCGSTLKCLFFLLHIGGAKPPPPPPSPTVPDVGVSALNLLFTTDDVTNPQLDPRPLSHNFLELKLN